MIAQSAPSTMWPPAPAPTVTALYLVALASVATVTLPNVLL
jgi:hypothetical protein